MKLKDLVRSEAGTYFYYQDKDCFKFMRLAKSYALRAKAKIKTEKFRCISVNSNQVTDLVKITVVKQGIEKHLKKEFM